jgi:hypothetical protein
MFLRIIFSLIIVFSLLDVSRAQSFPVFGAEKEVEILSLSFDAMEPFISPDGNTLFFNSLNSGGNTNLFYATKINDSCFQFIGQLNGTLDTSANHLDAVASMDSVNNFFWVSIREYPTIMENLHKGNYSSGQVTNIQRVYGDFYINFFQYPFGWLIMDACVSHSGEELYYCNAFFDFQNNGLPLKAQLGIAKKSNDSSFTKLLNSDSILQNINDTNYLVYAPQLSKNGLELYYTRLLKNTYNTEICLAVRANKNDIFSSGTIIHSYLGYFPEAATLSNDESILYYHQKKGTHYEIFMRYIDRTNAIDKQKELSELKIYPNPAKKTLYINYPPSLNNCKINIYNQFGQLVLQHSQSEKINISSLAAAYYIIEIIGDDFHQKLSFIKEE